MSNDKLPTKLERLLVAIDGSAIADYALNLAIHIGEKYGSKIDLLYVTNPSFPVPNTPIFDPMFGASVATRSPIEQAAAAKASDSSAKARTLLEQRKQLVESHNLACETLSIVSDDVGRALAEKSREYDMISTGSRGLSGLKSLILGSVSRKVAKEAKCSVLVVKSRIDSIPRMLLAYDGSDPAKKALLFASDLAKRFDALVSVICIGGIPISPEGFVSPNIDRLESEMKSYVEYAISYLKQNGIEADGQTADSQDVSRAIVAHAAKGNFDMIIVGSRGYGRLKSLFLGSVASSVADSSKTNVLIVR